NNGLRLPCNRACRNESSLEIVPQHRKGTIERWRVHRNTVLDGARVAISQAAAAILEEDCTGNSVLAAVFHHDLAIASKTNGKRNREAPHSTIEQKFLMLVAYGDRSGIRCASGVVAAHTALDRQRGRNVRLNLNALPLDGPGQ